MKWITEYFGEKKWEKGGHNLLAKASLFNYTLFNKTKHLSMTNTLTSFVSLGRKMCSPYLAMMESRSYELQAKFQEENI